FAHRVPLDLVAEAFQRVALGRVPGAFDELHDADPVAAPEHAQREPECRGRFSLAGPGVHHQQALFGGLAGDLGILHGLASFHLGAMAGGGGVVDGLGHGAVHFTTSGRPATISTTRWARAATCWLSRPCASRKLRASAFSGTMPAPTSFETRTIGT